MILTEDEAKTKVCPILKPEPAGLHSGVGGNGFAFRPRCLGSDCMAWRWQHSDPNLPKGFCGLASEPHQ